MAKIKKLANRKQIIKAMGVFLLADGLLSILILNILPQPSTGLNIAFLVRFIRAGIGLYLLVV